MKARPSAIGYVRVSTAKQREEGVGKDAQESSIRAWCAAQGYELVYVCVDAGISGKRMDNRPGLLEALQRARDGGALVTYSLSRLARSTKDAISIGERLDRQGADLVSISERIDTTTAAGKMVFRMLAVLAEFERDLVSERTTAALAHKRANGQVYGTVPFGYQARSGLLVKQRDEARVVSEILARRRTGESYRDIALDLNARGTPTKKGGRWHASTVRYIETTRGELA